MKENIKNESKSDAAVLPDHTERYVLWSKDGSSGDLIILVGYCSFTLAYYQAMFEDMKLSVPEITTGKAMCTKVHESIMRKSFTMMIVPIDGPERTIDRFDKTEWSSLRIDSYG